AMLLAPAVTGVAEGDRHRAPEETTGGPVDVRAAIFSLGVLLWELLACDPIPPGQQMTLRSIDAVRSQVPPALAAATMCAVEVRPDDRFAHADGFADELADALGRFAPGYGKDAAARWLHEHVSWREGESWGWTSPSTWHVFSSCGGSLDGAATSCAARGASISPRWRRPPRRRPGSGASAGGGGSEPGVG